jgi:hypothetical protein
MDFLLDLHVSLVFIFLISSDFVFCGVICVDFISCAINRKLPFIYINKVPNNAGVVCETAALVTHRWRWWRGDRHRCWHCNLRAHVFLIV